MYLSLQPCGNTHTSLFVDTLTRTLGIILIDSLPGLLHGTPLATTINITIRLTPCFRDFLFSRQAQLGPALRDPKTAPDSVNFLATAILDAAVG